MNDWEENEIKNEMMMEEKVRQKMKSWRLDMIMKEKKNWWAEKMIYGMQNRWEYIIGYSGDGIK